MKIYDSIFENIWYYYMIYCCFFIGWGGIFINILVLWGWCGEILVVMVIYLYVYNNK